MSQADDALIAAAAARGITISPTQLKRWRAAGLIDTPLRTAHGRGQGRTSDHYPPATIEWACLIATWTKHRVSLDDITLRMYVLGRDIAPERLTQAWRDAWKSPGRSRGRTGPMMGFLEWVTEALDSPVPSADLPSDHPFVRAMRHRLARRLAVLEDAMVAFLALLQGEDPSPQGFESFQRALGPIGSILNIETVQKAVRSLPLRNMDSLNLTRIPHLEAARDAFLRMPLTFNTMAHLTGIRGYVISPVTGESYADRTGVSGILLLMGIAPILTSLEGAEDVFRNLAQNIRDTHP